MWHIFTYGRKLLLILQQFRMQPRCYFVCFFLLFAFFFVVEMKTRCQEYKPLFRGSKISETKLQVIEIPTLQAIMVERISKIE